MVQLNEVSSKFPASMNGHLFFTPSAKNPGRFGPGSFRSESFRPGSFRPILGVGRFGLGRWVVSANFLGESIRPWVVSANVYGNLLESNNSKIN